MVGYSEGEENVNYFCFGHVYFTLCVDKKDVIHREFEVQGAVVKDMSEGEILVVKNLLKCLLFVRYTELGTKDFTFIQCFQMIIHHFIHYNRYFPARAPQI